jgi:outer membrane protein assembly factor BamB
MFLKHHSGLSGGSVVVALCAAAMLGSGASASWQQIQKLCAGNGGASRAFGGRVVLTGELAFVGSPGAGLNESHPGSVYVFNAITGEQLVEFTADDAQAADMFGSAIAIDGDLAVIGAGGHDEPYLDCGAAYVFDISDPADPCQLSKLTASNAYTEDYFGAAVAIEGTIAVIGAPFKANGAGLAYIFDVATGEQLHQLNRDDPDVNDVFGLPVAISGSTVLAGAYGDDDAGDDSGAVYVFNAETGEQTHKFVAEDTEAGDRFGQYFSMDGDIVLIGAFLDDDAGENAGAAYLFDLTDPTQPAQLTKFTADGVEADDRFGGGVCLRDDRAIVAAWLDDDAATDAGAAYLFDVSDPEHHVQLAKLTADDGETDERFGLDSVALAGDLALVGVRWDDDLGQASGSAYVFQRIACPADFDGDGDVDTADLLFLLGAWGTPAGDVDGDGDTDTADLLALLAAWGECP